MKKNIAVILALVLALTLIPATAFAAGDVTLTVGSGGTHATIQDAVDAIGTDAGTKTIKIAAGTYDETVQILQKPGVNIVLQGEEGTVFKGKMIIDGDGRYAGTETLTIKNIAFDKSGTALTSYVYVIDLKKFASPTYSYTHNVTIEDCSFVGDDSGEYTFAIQAGSSGGNTAYNTVIKNCTFTHLGNAIQARCTGLTVDNITATNMSSGGLNTQMSTNITISNSRIEAAKYGIRAGEGTFNVGSINITNCVISCPESSSEGALYLRGALSGTINITGSDILGNVLSSSTGEVKLNSDDVYWGGSITGFESTDLNKQNDSPSPHFVNTEVTADADVTYMIVITPNVDFGTISRDMSTQTKDFVVAVEDALIEAGASISVENTTTDMTMKDKDGAGSKSLAFTLAQPSGLFTFAQANLADGVESITSSVSCEPSQLQAAGSYKGYMTFEVSYNSMG
jgi:hypothetical protein